MCTRSSAGHRNAVGRASDSRAKVPGLDTRSGQKLLFLLPLIQEGQLSVAGENMRTKYLKTSKDLGLSLPRKNVVRLTDHPNMTKAVYHRHKTTQQYKVIRYFAFKLKGQEKNKQLILN